MQVATENNDVELADFVESKLLAGQVEDIKKVAEYVAELRRVGKGHVKERRRIQWLIRGRRCEGTQICYRKGMSGNLSYSPDLTLSMVPSSMHDPQIAARGGQMWKHTNKYWKKRLNPAERDDNDSKGLRREIK
ncbi:hypothetical protein PIB30_087472 [Stylosanthes scabra]|uniref:ferroxidase n=1 Tax=Stylosanthes scabra TaxID=79078 RepID=A0ABU6QSX5_9FABA|nr:hypothetical protein [Stylosanthes scabra]